MPPSPLLGFNSSIPHFTLRSLIPHVSNPRGIPVIPSRTMTSAPNRAFQLRVDPLTGESEWVVVEERGEATEVLEGSRSLLANTSYLDMLNDSCRNRAFRSAIEKTITEPCHVLDIGAGTGLLSMMAARAMSECGKGNEGKVSACESYLPMGKLMRRVLRANGMEKIVKVFHKRSDELHVGVDLDSRADVLVSEILDSELLGEGLIPTLQQAHDMLLVKNPKTVPYKATTYGQLVESTFLWKLHDLYSHEASTSDGIYLSPSGLERIIQVKPGQYAMHCNAVSEEIRLLSEPFKIFEFAFWKRPDSYRETEMQITTIGDGRIHALLSWWVLQLDQEGSVYYSTAPKWISSSNTQNYSVNTCGERNWCDHWKQSLWFIPGSGVPVSIHSDVLVKAVHDETSLSFLLEDNSSTCSNNFQFGDCHLRLPPEKIAVYGDKTCRSTLSNAAKIALQRAGFSPYCVIADDSVFLAIISASSSRLSTVIALFPGLQGKGDKFLQEVADANCFSMDQIQVVGKRASCLLTEDLNGRKVDLLIGEPFYCGNERMLPWQNLRFWKERTMLDPILKEDAVINL